MDDIGSGIASIFELIIQFIVGCVRSAIMPYRYILSTKYRNKKNQEWEIQKKKKVFDVILSVCSFSLVVLYASWLFTDVNKEKEIVQDDSKLNLKFKLGETSEKENNLTIKTENFEVDIPIENIKTFGKEFLQKMKPTQQDVVADPTSHGNF